MKKRFFLIFLLLIGIAGLTYFGYQQLNTPPKDPRIGLPLDSLHGVKVYFNGPISNVSGRNTHGGYNLGLKYQCVEFVKRYYYEYLQHEMPDSYGHAVSFYDVEVADSTLNPKRNLRQFSNPSVAKPEVSDLIVMDGTAGNPYGHVVIVSKVDSSSIEIIQQNPGPSASSRQVYSLTQTEDGKWKIEHSLILGWLRK